jgi:Mg2+-importing ATPase
MAWRRPGRGAACGYRNPFDLLLTALAALSWFSGDARATLLVSLMLALSTPMRFLQEGRARHAAASLRALVGNCASLRRRR